MNLNGTENPNKWTMRCFTMASSEIMDGAEVIGVFGHTMARRLVEYQNNLVDLLERDRTQLLAENQMLDGAIARLQKQCEDTRIALDASPRVPLAEAAKGYVSAYEDVVSEKMAAEETCDRLRSMQAERDEARAQRDEALSQLKTLGEELEEATVAHALAENKAIDLRARLERQKAARKADQERTNATINNFVNQRENLYQQIARLRTAGAEKWQAIESAPRDGTRVLVLFLSEAVCSAIWAAHGEGPNGGDWYTSIGKSLLIHPTHWRALPAPPAIGGENS